jgi:hypothetical protein
VHATKKVVLQVAFAKSRSEGGKHVIVELSAGDALDEMWRPCAKKEGNLEGCGKRLWRAILSNGHMNIKGEM